MLMHGTNDRIKHFQHTAQLLKSLAQSGIPHSSEVSQSTNRYDTLLSDSSIMLAHGTNNKINHFQHSGHLLKPFPILEYPFIAIFFYFPSIQCVNGLSLGFVKSSFLFHHNL